MSSFLQRAQLLIQQSRFELAETELRQALVENPNDSTAHALLAICFVESKKYNEATEAIQTAVSLAPDSSFNFYVASVVSDARNQLKKAESEIQQAISMDHTNPAYFGHLASIKLQQKKWQEGLTAAETGLEMDPENVTCTNLRAIAMVKLGRTEEAGATIQSALEKSPEDAHSHANMGWSLLEQGKPKEAMPHFREALRLEPNMEWARAGIVESMKSQYLIYRWMLGWFLFTAKLDSRTLMMILIGGYIGSNVASRMAANNPALQPFLLPLIVAYIGFVILTWVSIPMFNLLLRLNKFGRLVLSPEEKRTSTAVATCLLLAIAFVIVSFATGYDTFLVAALVCGLMMPIVATYYHSDPGWPRAAHGLMVIGFSLFGLIICSVSTGVYFTTGKTQALLNGLVHMSITPLVVIAVGSQFAVNFLAMAKPTKGTDNAKLVWLIGGIFVAVATMALVGFIALLLLSVDPTGPELN